MSSDKPAVGSNAVTGEPAVGKLIDALGQLALTEQRLRDLVEAMGNEETFYASTIEALQAAREHLDGESASEGSGECHCRHSCESPPASPSQLCTPCKTESWAGNIAHGVARKYRQPADDTVGGPG